MRGVITSYSIHYTKLYDFYAELAGVADVEGVLGVDEGRMQFTSKKVVVIGGGDTAMDVVSVARRLGHIQTPHENDRPEAVIHNSYNFV